MNESQSNKSGIQITKIFLLWLIFFVAFFLMMLVADALSHTPVRSVYPGHLAASAMIATGLMGLWLLVRWLCNRRHLGRFSVGLAIFATVVAIIYLEEDWRGKRAWENFKADAGARGAILDWAKFIPPAVPDDQNFFAASTNIAIRFKKAQTDAETKAAENCRWLPTSFSGTNYFSALSATNPIVAALVTVASGTTVTDRKQYDLAAKFDAPDTSQKAQDLIRKTIGRIADGATGIEISEHQISNPVPVQILLTSGSPIQAAELYTLVPTDLTTNLGKFLIFGGSNVFNFKIFIFLSGPMTSVAEYLKWSDQFEPAFDDLREALKRPAAVLQGDYSEPAMIPIPNFVAMRTAAQMLAQRAQCYMLLNEPDKAVRQIILMHDLCRILHRPPAGRPVTLVESMINVAIAGLYVATIQDGFRWHVWQEPQLAALQQQLENEDLPALVVDSLKSEEVFASAELIDTPTATLRKRIWIGKSSVPWEGLVSPSYLYFNFGPRGWVYQNAIHHVKWMQQFLQTYDVSNQLIYPKVVAGWTKGVEHFNGWAPYSYWEAIFMPNLLKAAQVTTFNQTQVNEAAIACALERYHLKNGRYPDTLDVLVPQFIEKLPHDIIGGQPLHYRRTDDGKFLLYSVGWNEKDDGGATGMITPGRGDYDKGDWVWRN